jgi:hypothetical protein
MDLKFVNNANYPPLPPFFSLALSSLPPYLFFSSFPSSFPLCSFLLPFLPKQSFSNTPDTLLALEYSDKQVEKAQVNKMVPDLMELVF